jgi:hypothetical protein
MKEEQKLRLKEKATESVDKGDKDMYEDFINNYQCP